MLLLCSEVMNHKPFSFLDVINDVFVVPAGNFFPVPIFFFYCQLNFKKNRHCLVLHEHVYSLVNNFLFQ